ncbi:MAG: alpha/beta hydrolase [Myxococcaceae bacterium]
MLTRPSTASARFGTDGQACLLLHGFTGTPWDLLPLAVALEQRGFSGSVPCLPGHGEDGEAMASVGADDWLRASEEALFAEFERTQRPVHVAGFSMGGLLAVGLAARWPSHVASLALLAPAARLLGQISRAARFLRKTPLMDWVQPYIPKDGSDIEDPAARAIVPRPTSFPSARLRDLFWLQDFAHQHAPRVKARVLLVLARHDHVVNARAAKGLVARIPRPDTATLLLERGFHGLARDFAGDVLAGAVGDFFRGALPSSTRQE